MDWHARLATLEAWQSTEDDARGETLAAVAAAMGEDWEVGSTRVGRAGLGELRHAALGAFVVVPGGWLRMGASVDDLYAAARARDDGAPEPTAGGPAVAARPTRWVRMRPYLLARAGLAPENDDAPISDGGAKSEAYRDAVEAQRRREAGDDADEPAPSDAEPPMRLVTPDEVGGLIPEGFRLPSEAELEWALREGGTTRWIGVAGDVEVTAASRRAVLLGPLNNGFGLFGLRDLQNLCADGAVNYDDDSPIDQTAVATDRPQRIARWAHTYWQDDDHELFGRHAANRAVPDEYGESIARLAIDVPGAVGPEGEPPPLAEHAAALAALTGADARAQADARSALAYLTQGSGADAGPTVTAVIDALSSLAPPLRAPLLVWLADVQVAGHRRCTVERPERARRATLAADRASVRSAVAAGAMTIAAFLDDDAPDVRSAAALALTFAVDAPAEAKAALAARLTREHEVGVQAALVLALIRLGSGFRAPAPDPVIRAAFAIATAFDGPANVDDLVTAAATLPPVPHLAYASGDLHAIAIGLLLKQPPEVQAEAAVSIADRAVAEADLRLARAVLQMAFGPPPEAPSLTLPEDLPSAQRQVMTKLLGFEQLPWRDYGLPPTAAGRRRALGHDEPGPTDRFVADGDAEVPLWLVLGRALAAGDKAGAIATLDRLAATWSAGERLAVFLDRETHGLAPAFRGWKRDELLAAAAADPEARAAVDAVLAGGQRSVDALRAAIATRPGERLPTAWLDDLADFGFGDAKVLAGFEPAAVEARLLALLAQPLARALANDNWVIGLDQQLKRWAGALAVAPSARATRQLLLLGWASGQPAAVREAVGAAGGHHAAVAEVLAQYDTLPEFTSWPRARAVLPTYAE